MHSTLAVMMLEVSTKKVFQPTDLHQPASSRRCASCRLRPTLALVLHELVLVGLAVLSGSIKYIAKGSTIV